MYSAGGFSVGVGAVVSADAVVVDDSGRADEDDVAVVDVLAAVAALLAVVDVPNPNDGAEPAWFPPQKWAWSQRRTRRVPSTMR
jgi:hypothetical protein